MKKLIFICSAAFLCNFSYAEDPWNITHDDAYCKNQGTYIFYVNGIDNSHYDASKSSLKIKHAYSEQLAVSSNNEYQKFDVSYNYSDTRVRDFIELIGQKLSEAGISDDIAHQYFWALSTANNIRDILQLPSAVHDHVLAGIDLYLQGRATATVDQNRHNQRYGDILKGNGRVLMIAHSQGNMFATHSMNTFSSDYPHSIGLIGVASPASDLPPRNSDYITADDDYIILLANILFDPLPANFNNSGADAIVDRDSFNHNFLASYFANGIPSRSKIDDYFWQHIEDLKPTNPDSHLASFGFNIWESANYGIEYESQTWPVTPHLTYTKIDALGPGNFLVSGAAGNEAFILHWKGLNHAYGCAGNDFISYSVETSGTMHGGDGEDFLEAGFGEFSRLIGGNDSDIYDLWSGFYAASETIIESREIGGKRLDKIIFPYRNTTYHLSRSGNDLIIDYKTDYQYSYSRATVLNQYLDTSGSEEIWGVHSIEGNVIN